MHFSYVMFLTWMSNSNVDLYKVSHKREAKGFLWTTTIVKGFQWGGRGLMILTRHSLVSLMGADMALTTVASSIIATSIPLIVEPNLPR